MVRVTLSGPPLCGKTTVARLLGETLGYEVFSVGNCIVRPLAAQYNMDVGTFYRKMKNITINGEKRNLDLYIDELQIKWASEHPDSVIESRLAGIKIPNEGTYKILLQVSPNVALARLLNDNRAQEQFRSRNEALDNILRRLRDEQKAYKKMYGIKNYLDPKYYDNTIDTDAKQPEGIVLQILKELRERKYLVLK